MSSGRYFAAELGGEVQIYRRGARGRVTPVAVVPSESAGNRLAAELNRGERQKLLTADAVSDREAFRAALVQIVEAPEHSPQRFAAVSFARRVLDARPSFRTRT